jgi:hypothetical protein
LTSVKMRDLSSLPHADSDCGVLGVTMRQTGARAVGSWCRAEIAASRSRRRAPRCSTILVGVRAVKRHGAKIGGLPARRGGQAALAIVFRHRTGHAQRVVSLLGAFKVLNLTWPPAERLPRRERARSGVPRPTVDAPSAQAGHQDRDATSYRSGQGSKLPLTCPVGAWWAYSTVRLCLAVQRTRTGSVRHPRVHLQLSRARQSPLQVVPHSLWSVCAVAWRLQGDAVPTPIGVFVRTIFFESCFTRFRF